MKVISSYAVELHCKDTKAIKDTCDIYRKALAFLIPVVTDEYDNIVAAGTNAKSKSKAMFNFAEKLFHTTKDNTAKYCFDTLFPKMPSYLRRAVIADAIGCVRSFKSNHENWIKNGKQGKEPVLEAKRFASPSFYKADMYKPGAENKASLKLFHNNDWVWFSVSLSKTDMRYIATYWSHTKASAPTLERKHRKYFLRFSFEESVELNKTNINDQRVCAVDLGLNTDAVCSIMTSDGTVLARKFIDFPSDKDQLKHVTNRIRGFQQKRGGHDVGSFWAYAKRLNEELAKKVALSIADFAVLYQADCVVFEYLDMKGCKKGKNAQKLSLWKRNSIQDYVEHKAHRCGIHVSRICAAGTSKYAYDGSGIVKRDVFNHSLATFSSGKKYNCDLSASYNIGARYFIREIQKSLPATERSLLSAQVPEAERRTSCTLSTLHKVAAALRSAA